LTASPNRGCELGSANAEARRGVALESAQAQQGELVANVVDPGSVLASREVAFTDE
jgi:hypothetical protein